MPWYMRLFFALPRQLRAALDPNDHSHADLWRAAGLHAAVPHLESLELACQTAALAELRATYALRPPSSARVLAMHELRIRVHADGEVQLLNPNPNPSPNPNPNPNPSPNPNPNPHQVDAAARRLRARLPRAPPARAAAAAAAGHPQPTLQLARAYATRGPTEHGYASHGFT